MKLSKFILDVVKTVRQVPRDKYLPNSAIWHKPSIDDEDLCLACLGGLYAAAKGWIQHHQRMFDTPENLNLTAKQTQRVLAADQLRHGQWLPAQARLDIPLKERIDMAARQSPVPQSPQHPSFYSWEELDAHLDSLEERALELQTLGQ